MSLVAGDFPGRHPGESPPGATAAIVVFVGETQVKFLRWLRCDFRHCFIVVRSGEYWIACDPLSHYVALTVLPPCQIAELASFFQQRGNRVIATTATIPQPALAPLRPFTCVEVVKRILGLRAPWVFTPWQLYNQLARGSKNSVGVF